MAPFDQSIRPPGRYRHAGLACLVAAVCAMTVGCQTFYGVQPPPPGVAVRITPGIPEIPNDAEPLAQLPSASLPTVEAPPLPAVPPDAVVSPSPALPLSRSVSPLVAAPADSTLTLLPQRMVAPVGSEVVLLAGLTDPQGRPIANQRVEWMIAPDSVGQFVSVGQENGFLSFSRPRKVDNSYAIATTSSRTVTLTRGTPAQIDDVAVQRGQAWVSVTSPTDGTSQVTAFAPGVIGWQGRQRTSTIYWVDAMFSFPAPAISAVGTRQVLNTLVTRTTDGSPIEGYLVRYSITDGPAAGFAPAGATSVEVPTDPEGRAAVEIFQATPARGANSVQVEIIRPADVPGADRRLVIGRGTTTMSWTAPEVTLTVTGPEQAETGSTVTNRIEVVNSGDLPLTGIVVTNRVPSGLNHRSSSIAPIATAGALQWQFETLAPRQTQSIDVTYDVLQSGAIENCATVVAAEGVRAENCLTMTSGVPSIELNISGPPTATVGQEVTFAISITNRAAIPIRQVALRDTFDAGFQHAMANSPIERDLGTLAAGQTRDDIGLTFTVTKPGRICHTVEVSGEGVATMRREICLDASPRPSEPSPGISAQKNGPKTARVGDLVVFTLTVTNTGETTLTNVRVVDTYERGLEPRRASQNICGIENGELVCWIPRLLPGQSQPMQVECYCDRETRACTMATVTADGDLTVAADACVNILPASEPPAGPPNVPVIPPNDDGGAVTAPPGTELLRVTISDNRDEAPVGTVVTYEIIVTNPRQVSDTNVVVTVIVPEGMTRVTGSFGPAEFVAMGQTIRFNSVAEIRPGDELPYRILLRADRAGAFRVEARVVSTAQTQPLVVSEDTNVFEE